MSMLSFTPFVAPLAAALALQLPPSSTPPAQAAPTAPQGPVTAESLIPANAVALVRVSSLDSLADTAQMLQRVADENAPRMDPLDLMRNGLGLDAPWELFDRKHPMVLAVAFSETRPPVALTIVATSTDAKKMAADPTLASGGWTCTVHGDLVVLSTEPNERTLAVDAPLRAGLERHALVTRIDVEEIMAQYGDLFRQGFQEAQETRLAEVTDDTERAMMQNMFDGILNGIETIETFGMALDSNQGRTQFAFELTAMEGSPMLDVGRVDTSALATLTRAIEPNAPIAVVGAMDFTAFLKSIEPLMEMGAKQAAERAAAGGDKNNGKDEVEKLLATVRASRDAYAAMGPLLAMGMRLDGSGMTTTYAMRPPDTTKCIDALMNAMRTPLLGATIEGPADAVIAGHAVKSVKMHIQAPENLGMGDVEHDADAARAAMAEAFTKLFGTDGVPMTFAPHEGSLLVTVGAPAEMETSLARFAGTNASPAGADVLRALGAMNPGFAMRLSAQPLLEGISAFAVRMGADPMPIDDAARAAMKACPPAYMMAGLDGRTWRLAMDMDMPAIGRMVRAIQAAEHASNPDMIREDALLEMIDVQYALADFAMNNGGQYPDDVKLLIQKDTNGEAYLDDAKQLFDLWGRPYRFERPKEEGALPRVFTLGADDQPGGEGINADVTTEEHHGDDEMGDGMDKDDDDDGEEMDEPR